MKELAKIQAELKAPKGQYNNFGKYNYRSCEDILEALKPLLQKHDCMVTLDDTVIPCGERVYIRAMATIRNSSGESLNACGYAREPEDKKGMDVSQITGSCSSYARKYALNGLFAIDDNKDADTIEPSNKLKEERRKPSSKNTIQEAIKIINRQNNLSDLRNVFTGLNATIKKNPDVISAKDLKKAELERNAI